MVYWEKVWRSVEIAILSVKEKNVFFQSRENALTSASLCLESSKFSSFSMALELYYGSKEISPRGERRLQTLTQHIIETGGTPELFE